MTIKWVALLLFFLTGLSYLLPFTYWPEMLNWPFFMSRGWSPYQDFFMIHTPVLPVTLNIFYSLLGFSPSSLHLFGTLLLCLIALLIARLSLISLPLFIFLVLALGGNTVWFESLLAPILLLIYTLQLLYLRKPQKRLLLGLGLLTGMAVLTKQTAFYIFPAFLPFFWHLRRSLTKPIVLTTLPFISVLVLFYIILQDLTLGRDFWRWAVTFVFLKPFEDPGYILRPSLWQLTVLMLLFLPPLLAFLKKPNFILFFTLLWAGLSFLFALPRFGYFHLVPFAVFLSLAYGQIRKINPTYFWRSLLVFFPVTAFIFSRTLLYAHTFLEPEVMATARYLNSAQGSKSLFVLNGPDQLYSLTTRLPAVHPWIPQLPWYLHFYDSFSQDFFAHKPDIIVLSPYLSRPVDGLGSYRPPLVVDYVASHYREIAHFGSLEVLEKND